MPKEIIVTVSASGEITVETKGYKGASCKDATAALEKSLGVVREDKKKPEYFQAATTTTTQAA